MKVFFGLPCYGQQLSMHTADSLNATLLELAFRKIFPVWSYQSAVLPYVRNLIIKTFIEGNCTHLFWIDTDIGFKPSDVLKLLKLDVDIAVASYVKKQAIREHTVMKDERWINVDEFTEPMLVDSGGMGFVCAKREVIQSLYDKAIKNDDGIPLIVETGNVYGLHCETEDHAFFKKAQMLGFKIWLDPSIKLTHYGMHAYT